MLAGSMISDDDISENASPELKTAVEAVFTVLSVATTVFAPSSALTRAAVLVATV